MRNVLRFLNGKKTIIGLASALAAAYARDMGWIGAVTFEFLLGLSAILFGVGAGHKAVKARRKDVPKDRIP